MLRATMTDTDILPSAFTRGRPIGELVELEVTDAHGRTLFQYGLGRRAGRSTTRPRVGETFGRLRVRAQIRAAMADQLVIGGLPRSRLPFLLALLGIAAALSFVAVAQLRREGELARLRADFVANISHELRTPLAQMRLYLETLRLGRFTTDAQRSWSLDNVERETTRLGASRRARAPLLARASAPAPDPRQPTDVAAELRRIVAEFQPLADARGAKLVAADRRGADGRAAAGRAAPHRAQPARQRGEVRTARPDGAGAARAATGERRAARGDRRGAGHSGRRARARLAVRTSAAHGGTRRRGAGSASRSCATSSRSTAAARGWSDAPSGARRADRRHAAGARRRSRRRARPTHDARRRRRRDAAHRRVSDDERDPRRRGQPRARRRARVQPAARGARRAHRRGRRDGGSPTRARGRPTS